MLPPDKTSQSDYALKSAELNLTLSLILEQKVITFNITNGPASYNHSYIQGVLLSL